jgi:hypothetical protein
MHYGGRPPGPPSALNPMSGHYFDRARSLPADRVQLGKWSSIRDHISRSDHLPFGNLTCGRTGSSIAPCIPAWKAGVCLSTPMLGEMESRAGMDFPKSCKWFPKSRGSLRESQSTSLCGFAGRHLNCGTTIQGECAIHEIPISPAISSLVRKGLKTEGDFEVYATFRMPPRIVHSDRETAWFG